MRDEADEIHGTFGILYIVTVTSWPELVYPLKYGLF